MQPRPQQAGAGWYTPPAMPRLLSVAAPGSLASVMSAIGLVTVMLIIFVTLHPFDPPPQPVVLNPASAEGDALRQVAFLGAFGLIVLSAIALRGLEAVRSVPVSMGLLLIWCVGSAIWASAPDIVFRRATLTTIVTLSILLATANLGSQRAFQYLRLVMIGVLIANWIGIPTIPTAVHLPDEIDPKLIGDWRGLYAQKNGAGAVCAMTVLVFLFGVGRPRRWTDWLVVLGAIGFLIGTRSKTSMGLLPVAALAGGLYRVLWRKGLDRAIAALVILTLIFTVVMGLIYESDTIARLMDDPDMFTGRTEIWKADIAYLRDHFFLGAGFGVVWGTGGPPFLLRYANTAWVLMAASTHNGYVELLVGLGAVGFTLAAIALAVIPLVRFWPLEQGPETKAGIFALYIFVLLRNLTESDFLATDSSGWLILMIIIAGLREKPAQIQQAWPVP